MYVRLASCCQQWLASLYFYRLQCILWWHSPKCKNLLKLKPGQPLRGAHWTYVLVTNFIFFKFMVKRVVFWCRYYYWQTLSLLTPYCTNFFLWKRHIFVYARSAETNQFSKEIHGCDFMSGNCYVLDMIHHAVTGIFCNHTTMQKDVLVGDLEKYHNHWKKLRCNKWSVFLVAWVSTSFLKMWCHAWFIKWYLEYPSWIPCSTSFRVDFCFL